MKIDFPLFSYSSLLPELLLFLGNCRIELSAITFTLIFVI
ncbi:hypothetical protein AM1_0291 [Acaryochloris marina MBIC11017]|uniref:Uncharacterized protein n=1 Tax=Acaryochloris marina (strain MBIC 11017) TaxID=329726 RepID=B0C8Y7_ACAM1|nr:hypothetical protein AM1_0291 [Acaryochloris marina MBIC11017]